MKHLAIITQNMSQGGAEQVILQLAQYLIKQNIKCSIITIFELKQFYNIPMQVETYVVGKKAENKAIDKFLKYKQVRNYVKQLKPDLVLAIPEEVGIYVIPALMGTRIPLVVSERNNPWVMPWKKITRLMRRLFYPFASGFIFQTEQAAGFFPKSIRRKGIVLPNMLDLERLPEMWTGEIRKEVVSAGRLESQKNFPLLINAFAKFYIDHPEYTLTIYGDGSLKEYLESVASCLLPKSAYSFPGGSLGLLEKIRKAEMFVLSSDYEGMPNVVIEAMALGMPVIATDCPSGGPAGLIEDGKNGILVPVNDSEALCNAMCKVADSRETAANLASNAVQIRQRLDSKVVSEMWKKYLASVASALR